MKKTYLFYILSLVMLVGACSTPSALGYERNGKVVCTNHDDRTASFRTNSSGSSQAEASFNAEVNVFENILYKGIPASSQERPLISSAKRTSQTDQVLAGFFSDREYLKYITHASITSHQVSKKIHYIEESMTIDMTAFRKYLEDQNIIKKFGI